MGDVRVDGKDSAPIKTAEEMVGRFQAEVMIALPAWKDRLRRDPGEMESLEREVQSAYARGAGLLMAGLVALSMKQEAFDQACERTREGFAYPLERGRQRPIRVRLLGGLVMWVTSLYCVPRMRPSREKRSEPGVYVELAQFGFSKGCTPGLQGKVARQAALCPSFAFAQQELERDGMCLDVKTVRRIATQCGESLLRIRMDELSRLRAGTLPAGTELAGQRVSVQVDGGRSRIRGDLRDVPLVPEATDANGLPIEDAPGRSRKRPRKTFDADWREPKLLTIFVHDENGRMVKKTRATIDGTFLGPDALAELVALHLHRLGAARAKSITFISDGGVWIWDRIPAIKRLAKLTKVPIHQVLDCWHAAHHISEALKEIGVSEAGRTPLFRQYRTLLRNGQWQRVVAELTDLASDKPADSEVWTEIAYLQKHGDAGRLKYPTFRGMGLPIGSGAIESSIRRVINLRLKGNAIYWREDNAEAMLQVRAQVLTNRWDDRLHDLRNFRLCDARTAWRWEPQDMSSKTERARKQPRNC